GMRWQSVSTWMMNCRPSPSSSRISISRSKIASQLRLRAKLSSVMKNRKTPCARLARTSRSMSSASRQRDFRPCTLMIVQKLHWNGKPRRQVHRARELVRLHAHEADEPGIGAPDPPDDALHRDDRVALVIGVDLDRDIGSERAPLGQIRRNAVEAGERIRRDPRLPPL